MHPPELRAQMARVAGRIAARHAGDTGATGDGGPAGGTGATGPTGAAADTGAESAAAKPYFLPDELTSLFTRENVDAHDYRRHVSPEPEAL